MQSENRPPFYSNKMTGRGRQDKSDTVKCYEAWSSGTELGWRLSEGVRRQYDQANVTLQPWQQECAEGDVILSGKHPSLFLYLSLYIIQSFSRFLSFLPLNDCSFSTHVFLFHFQSLIQVCCYLSCCLILCLTLIFSTSTVTSSPLSLSLNFYAAEKLMAACFYFHYSRED